VFVFVFVCRPRELQDGAPASGHTLLISEFALPKFEVMRTELDELPTPPPHVD
jgi:hypothetical protein